MPVTLHALTALDVHRATPLPIGWPHNLRILYAPVDDVHAALLDLVRSTTRSLSLAMYALDDRELADAVRVLCADPHITVQITLDGSQAGTAFEAALLTAERYPATSIAVGSSERGSLMHLKDLVVDGWYVATGSTNWSRSGQSAQDNTLTVIKSRVVADTATARLAAIHAHILTGR